MRKFSIVRYLVFAISAAIIVGVLANLRPLWQIFVDSHASEFRVKGWRDVHFIVQIASIVSAPLVASSLVVWAVVKNQGRYISCCVRTSFIILLLLLTTERISFINTHYEELAPRVGAEVLGWVVWELIEESCIGLLIALTGGFVLLLKFNERPFWIVRIASSLTIAMAAALVIHALFVVLGVWPRSSDSFPQYRALVSGTGSAVYSWSVWLMALGFATLSLKSTFVNSSSRTHGLAIALCFAFLIVDYVAKYPWVQYPYYFTGPFGSRFVDFVLTTTLILLTFASFLRTSTWSESDVRVP